jgi:hypothetical protein
VKPGAFFAMLEQEMRKEFESIERQDQELDEQIQKLQDQLHIKN